MLNTLRESANGVFAKVLMALLVLSFGIWGIGDIFRQIFDNSSVATVGHASISMQEYQRTLRAKQEELGRMLGNKYDPEVMKKLGLEQYVLSNMINGLVKDKEAESLGIVVGDDAIVEAIRVNPAFAGDGGDFNKARYLEVLRDNRVNEQNYVSGLRKELEGKVLNDTFNANIVVSESLVQALYKVREEQRVADFTYISADAVGAIPAPDDKEIKGYYDEHSALFKAPEYRTVSYVMLKLADIEKGVSVSEEEIKHVYDDHIQDYRKPERRTVEQMLFDSQVEAQKASDALSGGARFSDVAKNFKLINKDKLSMGEVTKQDAVPEAADAIFALKENGVTKPVSTTFGWHIFHVSKITPESVTPLEDVRADITKELAAKQAQDTIYKLVGQLEDELSGGSTLQNAAEKIGQKVAVVGPVNHEGLSPDGKKVTLPAIDSFMSVAFSLQEKDHSQATQTSDGSYFLVRADSVEPEHVRALADVKSQVIDDWKKEKKFSLLHSATDDISAQVRAGKKMQDALAAHHISAETFSSGKLKRGTETFSEGELAKKPLPRNMVFELFNLKPHETTHAYPLVSGGAIIATLSQVTPAPAKPDEKALQAIRDELKKSAPNEVLSHYFIYLRDKYGVRVNTSAVMATEESGQ